MNLHELEKLGSYWINSWFNIFDIDNFSVCVCVCVCVCVTGHQSLECVQIMRWWTSNIVQWPIRNLGYVTYCYTAIIDPTHPLPLPPNILPGEADPSWPKTPSTNVHILSTQDHLNTRASPVSVPEYRYVCASYSPVSTSNPPTHPLPCHRHTCRIPVAATTLPLPQYILTSTSAVSLLPPVSTKDPPPPLVTRPPRAYHKYRP